MGSVIDVVAWLRAAITWCWICFINVLATRLRLLFSLNSILKLSSRVPVIDSWLWDDEFPCLTLLVLSPNGCFTCVVLLLVFEEHLFLPVELPGTTFPSASRSSVDVEVRAFFKSSTFTLLSVYWHLLSLSWSVSVMYASASVRACSSCLLFLIAPREHTVRQW